MKELPIPIHPGKRMQKEEADSMRDNVLQMIGLAERAGRIRSGGFETEEAVLKGKAKLVILAGDASENTSKRFDDKCRSHGVPVIRYGTRETLGACIGKEERSCLAVTDYGFAKKIRELSEEGNGGSGSGAAEEKK